MGRRFQNGPPARCGDAGEKRLDWMAFKSDSDATGYERTDDDWEPFLAVIANQASADRSAR